MPKEDLLEDVSDEDRRLMQLMWVEYRKLEWKPCPYCNASSWGFEYIFIPTDPNDSGVRVVCGRCGQHSVEGPYAEANKKWNQGIVVN